MAARRARSGRPAAAVAAALAWAGCGDNLAAPPDARDPTPPPDAGPAACEVTLGEPALALELVADGLRFPVDLVQPPGDPRLFVVLQDGLVRTIEGGEVRDAPYLDITEEVGVAYEQGLLSLAFHPAFATNGRFFVSWARDGDDAMVVEEWRIDDPLAADADGATRRTLFTVEHTANHHYGAHLLFGPDGLLYVSVGNGAPQLDPDAVSQDLSTLRGKLLRIDVDAGDDTRPYGIPPDNPLVGVAGARPEIAAIGLRNPWRMALDPVALRLYLGDVGFASREEIDTVDLSSFEPMANFGWPATEGTLCRQPPCDGLDPPIEEYTHGDGCAIVLGPVYRGCAMPGYHGRLFYADFCGGWIHSLVYALGEVVLARDHPELDIGETISGFGRDALGEIYALSWKDGAIFKIVAE